MFDRRDKEYPFFSDKTVQNSRNTSVYNNNEILWVFTYLTYIYYN